MTLRQSLIFGYVLLASLCAFSTSHPCTLKVFEESSGDLIEDLCLEEYNDSDCRPFLEHFSRSDLPDGFFLTDDDDSVQRPESLDLTFSMEQVNQKGSKSAVPAVRVHWSPPVAETSRNNAKGYLLIWENSIEVMCRIFQFDSNKTDLLSNKLRFQYQIQYLDPGTNYQVKVYSMPPPKNLKESQKKSTFMSLDMTSGSFITANSNPAKWLPSLSTRVLEEGAIEVKIALSSSHFNLTQFKVMLIKRSYDVKIAFQEIIYKAPPDSQDSQALVKFANLDNDKYKLVIRVIDPFHKQVGKCLCWVKATKGRYCANSCQRIATEWIMVPVTDPGRWIPPWSTRVIKEKGAIEVKIGHSPPRFNLTQFKLYLFKRDFYEKMDVTAISYREPPGSQKPEGLVYFTNLDNDEYQIVIQAIDPFHRQFGKCLCWIKGPAGKQCNNCAYATTDWIKVSADVPKEAEEPKTERSRNSSPSEFNTCIMVTGLLTLQIMMFDLAVYGPYM
ncbi:hypothetical protein RRG08_032419 [Elysia crispata]|uniref:Fibronectin type-III domain-containing protein n=1 Tax=Elysia crispata TaxID=231223 RepID=A0AAE0XNW8_9GAST|nr:hypothetical protein RRG08_032419 [Elysia crispata]